MGEASLSEREEGKRDLWRKADIWGEGDKQTQVKSYYEAIDVLTLDPTK